MAEYPATVKWERRVKWLETVRETKLIYKNVYFRVREPAGSNPIRAIE
jgi:hypothetical protein